MRINILHNNNTICIDFDGVLAGMTSNISDYGSPISGGAEATHKLRELGYRLIIHTARPNSGEHIRRLKTFLEENNILFDNVNTDPESPWNCDKPLADFYIDDRAVQFKGDWDDVLWQVMSRNRRPAIDEYRLLLGFIRGRMDQVRALDRFLSSETSWLTAPASTRFHLAEEGGLLKHSVNVARTIIRLRRELMPKISLESCIIVSLFHDTGKAGFAGIPFYITNPDEWQVKKRGIKYAINSDCVHMDIATRSLFLVSKHVELTPEEAQAIRFHDGQYIEENRSAAHRETPLTLLLQYADNWSGAVLEGDN